MQAPWCTRVCCRVLAVCDEHAGALVYARVLTCVGCVWRRRSCVTLLRADLPDVHEVGGRGSGPERPHRQKGGDEAQQQALLSLLLPRPRMLQPDPGGGSGVRV